jgi:hypothetical protein
MPKSYDPEYYAKNREKLKARSLAYYHRKAEERRHAYVPPAQRTPWATDSSANGLKAVRRIDVSGGMQVSFDSDDEDVITHEVVIHGLIEVDGHIINNTPDARTKLKDFLQLDQENGDPGKGKTD